ncbi:MAG TPA: DUF4432 family protein [Acidimicrobiales bacterium]|nr:DUF4432 family protein [Acidimicrobiales bacterium]
MTHYGPEHTYGARADDAWTYRGLKTVVIENEVLRAVVLADKGADIYSLVHKPTDTEYLWRSPWGVRNPRHYVPTTGDGVGLWVDFYEGGWQTVVPAGGRPASYGNADLGQHGEASVMPWDSEIVSAGPERAVARFRVRLARTPLIVTKELSLVAGSPTLEVTETVTNVGAEDLPMVYGQHIALGPPSLSDHCVIDLPGGTVLSHPVEYSPNNRMQAGTSTPWPKGVLKDGSEVSMREVLGPGARVDDQAYITDLPDGWYAVTNTETGVGIAVRFPHELFRWLWYWQMFGGGVGYPWWGQTYDIGLEPFTGWPNLGLEEAIANGSALTLAAGETLSASLLVSAFEGREGVASVGPDGSVVQLDQRR